MKRRFVFLFVLSIAAVSAPGLLAQQTLEDQIRRLESEKATEILTEPAGPRAPKGHKPSFDWGAFTTVNYLSFDDDDNNARAPDAVESLLLRDVRVWGRAMARDGSLLYGRLRYLDYRFDLRPGVRDPDFANEGWDVDQLYYQFNLDPRTQARVGRQYLRQGLGLTFDGLLDAAKIERRLSRWTFLSFIGKNPPQDLDRDPRINRPRRFYGSAYASYLIGKDRRAFVYYLGERDDSKQPATIPARTQRFDYDADYVSIGSAGKADEELSYYVEAIWEGGSQIARGASAPRVDIDANAALAGLIYEPRGWKGTPAFTLEYAHGSGDPTRLPGSSTVSGRPQGEDDASFYGFGRYDGGLALLPRLSNLIALRAGASWRPFHDRRRLRTLRIGAILSRYYKDDPAGGTSDFQAIRPDDDVGSAIDLSLQWRPSDDLSLSMRWGRFHPGDAYPAATRDDTETASLAATYYFNPKRMKRAKRNVAEQTQRVQTTRN